VDRSNSASRFVAQEKFNLWPQAHLHTQWPGSGEPDDDATMQLASGQLPAIASFTRQQFLNRDALVALLEKIGPSILMVHSQAGAFGWPVADMRPDLVKALLAIEPNGPPFYSVEFVGAPTWFKQGASGLDYGITSVPLTYAPPLKSAAELDIVVQEKPDEPDLVRCYAQKEPARQLPNLQKMPILVLTAEASYHAPYDHCTVKYLQQAGVKPSFIRLADLGIKGNSHVKMLEKNNKEIAAVIAQWLGQTLEGKEERAKPGSAPPYFQTSPSARPRGSWLPDGDEGRDVARRRTAVRLGAEHRADQRRHLIDAGRPFVGDATVVIVFPTVGLGAGTTGA